MIGWTCGIEHFTKIEMHCCFFAGAASAVLASDATSDKWLIVKLVYTIDRTLYHNIFLHILIKKNGIESSILPINRVKREKWSWRPLCLNQTKKQIFECSANQSYGRIGCTLALSTLGRPPSVTGYDFAFSTGALSVHTGEKNVVAIASLGQRDGLPLVPSYSSFGGPQQTDWQRGWY